MVGSKRKLGEKLCKEKRFLITTSKSFAEHREEQHYELLIIRLLLIFSKQAGHFRPLSPALFSDSSAGERVISPIGSGPNGITAICWES
jgi:hypothetical protein